VAGQELSLSLDDPGGVVAAGDQFTWDFGDGGQLTTEAPQARHRFLSAARSVREFRSAGAARTSRSRSRRSTCFRARSNCCGAAAGSLRGIATVLTLVSLAIAVITGMGLLFLGKSFGTPLQYLEAFLWGFGIDSSVRNVADLMKKVS
jgi:hypothetical protein